MRLLRKSFIYSVLVLLVFSAFGSDGDLNIALSLQNSFNKAARSVTPLVVRIDTTFTEGKGSTLGSGLVVKRVDGEIYVITNHHVVYDATFINVTLFNDKQFEADVVGSDKRTDIAVIKFVSDEKFTFPVIGDSAKLVVGDWAIGIGNPFGFNGSVSVGVISALGRSMAGSAIDATDFIQTDAAINPGNSGGPLINIKGEVIGINSWIASRSGSNSGLGFAVPINTAILIFNRLIEYKKVDYAWLGVYIQSLTNQVFRESMGIMRTEGAYVTKVIEDSPADKSQLKVNDIIIRVNDKDIRTSNELVWEISGYFPGDTVKITLLRDGKEMTFDIELERRPGSGVTAENEETKVEPVSFLGALMNNISNDIKEALQLESSDGVVILEIAKNSPAENYGLFASDIVKKINTVEIKSIEDVKEVIEEDNNQGNKFYYFLIIRDKREMIIGVKR